VQNDTTITDKTTGQRITFVESTPERVVSRVDLPAGAKGPPRHRHVRFDETFAVEEGELTLRLFRGRRRLRAGESVTVSPGQVHTFENVSSGRTTFVCTVAPAWHFEEGIRAITALTNEKGRAPRSPALGAAVAYLLDANLPGLPIGIQRTLLGPLRSRGLRQLRERGLAEPV
jgi:mannose-6-phosphate isomerase-like protein (cupin superfamily)